MEGVFRRGVGVTRTVPVLPPPVPPPPPPGFCAYREGTEERQRSVAPITIARIEFMAASFSPAEPRRESCAGRKIRRDGVLFRAARITDSETRAWLLRGGQKGRTPASSLLGLMVGPGKGEVKPKADSLAPVLALKITNQGPEHGRAERAYFFLRLGAGWSLPGDANSASGTVRRSLGKRSASID